MGRASRAKKEQAAKPEPVTLPADQYFRLMSLSKDVALEIQRAEQQIARAQAAVREREAARDAYMAKLTAEHPALDFKAVRYAGDDATCTLTPDVSGGQK